MNFPSINVKTKDLIPYARNSRIHSDEQVTQIASSIREFGFTNPVIIDDKNNIIAGHGRVMAAKKLGIDEVPCVVVTGWTEAQKKAYVIADNKLALNAGWDMDTLKLEFQEIDELKFDLSFTGFSVGELSSLFDLPDFEAGTEAEQGKLDELSPKIVNCPHCGEDFDSRGREQ